MTIVSHRLKHRKTLHFFPHSLLIYFIWILQLFVVPQNSFSLLVFVAEILSVYCKVKTGSLNIILINFAHVVNRRPVSAETRVRFWGTIYEVCGGWGQVSLGQIIATLAFPVSVIPPSLNTHLHFNIILLMARRRNFEEFSDKAMLFRKSGKAG